MRKKFTGFRLQGTVILISLFILCTLFLLKTTNYQLPTANAAADSCITQVGNPRADGLISAPSITGKFGNTTGICIKDPKAAFVPYKIATYADLKSNYFDQAKASNTVVKHDLPAGDKTQSDIPLSAAGNHLYYVKKTSAGAGDGNLTITGNIAGNKTGVVFVEGNLRIGPIPGDKFNYGTSSTGLLFIVKGDVYIDSSVTQLDAAIVAEGTIYTATTGSFTCNTNSKVASQLTINGSLISIGPNKIKFCRSLSGNNNFTQPAEKVIHQSKYVVILKDLAADTLEKWSETTQVVNYPSPVPSLSTIPSPSAAPRGAVTYTLASGYSGTQGPIWYYYYQNNQNITSPAVYTTLNKNPFTLLAPEFNNYKNTDGKYWTVNSNSTVAIGKELNVPAEESVIIYWKAPGPGMATITATEQRAVYQGSFGDGFRFTVGYVPSVGQALPDHYRNSQLVLPGSSNEQQMTVSQRMSGNDALYYYKDAFGNDLRFRNWLYDTSKYTLRVDFVPDPPDCTGGITCTGSCQAAANTCSADNGTKGNCKYTTGAENCKQKAAPDQKCTKDNCTTPNYSCSNASCVLYHCDSGISCTGACQAPSNTCNTNNGTKGSCQYTTSSRPGVTSCNRVAAPNQSCTLSNCSSGYSCSSGTCLPYCNKEISCTGACKATYSNTCSAYNGTQDGCTVVGYTGGGECVRWNYGIQYCTVDACQSPLVCNQYSYCSLPAPTGLKTTCYAFRWYTGQTYHYGFLEWSSSGPNYAYYSYYNRPTNYSDYGYSYIPSNYSQTYQWTNILTAGETYYWSLYAINPAGQWSAPAQTTFKCP